MTGLESATFSTPAGGNGLSLVEWAALGICAHWLQGGQLAHWPFQSLGSTLCSKLAYQAVCDNGVSYMHLLRIFTRNTERTSHFVAGNEAGEEFIPVANSHGIPGTDEVFF